MADIDVIFLASNRLEFTRESLSTLVRNTDWSLVHTLYLYDDDSEDGTREYLQQTAAELEIGCAVEFRAVRIGCPLEILIDCLTRSSEAPYIAKIDNDVMVCEGWLKACRDVMEENPELDMLGLGFLAGPPGKIGIDRFGYSTAPFVGGVGLFRKEPIIKFYRKDRAEFRPKVYPERTFAGINQSEMNVGWLWPNLPVFLLDKIAFEPWRGYSERYIEKGWQRFWRYYYDDIRILWSWWHHETA